MESPSEQRRSSWGLASFAAIVFLIFVIGPLGFVYLNRTADESRKFYAVERMRPLGETLQRYTEVHDGLLPPGTMPGAELPPAQRLSWQVAISETEADPSLPWNAETNLKALEPLSDSIRRTDPPGFVPTRTDLPLPATPYIGMAGIGPDAPSYSADNALAGVFGYDRQLNLKDVTDGLSNTIAVITTTLDNGPWAQGGSATVRGLNPRMRPYFGSGRQFGGLFDDGGHVLFLDGRVSFITNSIDPRVFEALTTVAGGEQIDGDPLAPRARVIDDYY